MQPGPECGTKLANCTLSASDVTPVPIQNIQNGLFQALGVILYPPCFYCPFCVHLVLLSILYPPRFYCPFCIHLISIVHFVFTLFLLSSLYPPCSYCPCSVSSKGLTLAAGMPQPPWLTQLTAIALTSVLAPGACVEVWFLAHYILQSHLSITGSRGSGRVWCKNGLEVITCAGM